MIKISILIFVATLILIGENLQLKKINIELEKIEQSLNLNNIFYKSYLNFKIYQDIKQQISFINNQLQNGNQTKSILVNKEILEQEYELLKNTKSPFNKLLHNFKINNIEVIKNPFQIIVALSHQQQNLQYLEEYKKNLNSIKDILDKFKYKLSLLEELNKIKGNQEKQIEELKKDILFFTQNYEAVKLTYKIYQQRIDEVNLDIDKKVQEHLQIILNIIEIFSFVIAIAFLLKFLIGKYINDNQKIYVANKSINILTMTIVFLVGIFSYIDNIDNLITILGFVSAGLAIAMKDGFMSIFAWFVIIFGGAIKSGDRIKVTMNGAEYVGDILDISLLRITLQEDITLTTFNVNRRAGRVIFVPNNYIFTNLIVNYSHYTLRTVWDGIDIVITFDSNYKKAIHIMKEIAKNYASGYTDMTRKQLNKLRDRYNLRNANVEPRMLSFIDTYGIKLSVWYLTNAYGTLTLRSNISIKIIEAFNNEDDIQIAYPTQTIQIPNLKQNDKTIN
jgi:small-conductance mechanosensitive channel